MKNFKPPVDEVLAMRAEKGIGIEQAKAVLTGRKVLEELQDISSKIEYGVHPDHTAQQLARLTDVIIFMVSNGSIHF